ncbi:hypothetical protein LCGC14_2068410 [marine sediment metagenome]|uniref:Uncharacterized protein n=1 Tax=marine sediment metagenome TaxID=412755 RepID=A0A0F9F6G9_9ZZZZ
MHTDGTETSTDVTLGTEETGTPKEDPQFDQAHVDKAVLDAKTAALADVGRFQREAQTAVKAAEAALERTKKIRKEQDEAEIKAAEGDSEQLSAVKERQRRRDVESELDEVTLKLNQRDDKITQLETSGAEATKVQTARDVATRLGVDADSLIRLTKFTDGSVESIEELARELPKKTVRPKVVTDSNVETEGKKLSEQDKLNKLYPTMARKS